VKITNVSVLLFCSLWCLRAGSPQYGLAPWDLELGTCGFGETDSNPSYPLGLFLDCHSPPLPECRAGHAAGCPLPGELFLPGRGTTQQAGGGSQVWKEKVRVGDEECNTQGLTAVYRVP
jgi:hypothetical protein